MSKNVVYKYIFHFHIVPDIISLTSQRVHAVYKWFENLPDKLALSKQVGQLPNVSNPVHVSFVINFINYIYITV